MNKYLLLSLVTLFTFSIYAQTADFNPSPASGCAPLKVTFNDASTGATSWQWSLGVGGNTSTNQNPSVLYTTPGTYSITLVINGDPIKTKTKTVQVFANPDAKYTTTPDSVCEGKTITFNDNSTVGSAPIKQWNWDFGDGATTTSTINSTTHAFINGSYKVNLTIVDNNGCQDTITKRVDVLVSPTAAFTSDKTSGCTAPLTVQFTNSNPSGTSYTWRFGDGTTSNSPNPSHTYNAIGSYDVTYIVNQNGCIDSLPKAKYIIIQKIKADLTKSKSVACINDPISFTDASTPLGTSAQWNFGDGTTGLGPTTPHAYSTAGTYTVTLTVTDAGGCVDSAKTSVTISLKVTADFTATPAKGCAIPFNAPFTNASVNGVTYSWYFGDASTSTQTSPTHAYNAFGSYTVTLVAIGATGCKDSVVKADYISIVNPTVQIASDVIEGCIPLTVNFTNINVSPNDPVTTYAWNFGEPSSGALNTSTQQSPQHIYNTEGVHTISLTVTTGTQGCTATTTYTVQCGLKPMAEFIPNTPQTICFGSSIQFNDVPHVPAPDTWVWSFSDGSGDGGPNPLHLFNSDTGTFNVTYIVKRFGCIDDTIVTSLITVRPAQAGFDTTYTCGSPLLITLGDDSKGAMQYSWDFGDGGSSTSVGATSHTYATLGTYTVTQIVVNTTFNCSDTARKVINLTDPQARIKNIVQTGCFPLTLNYVDSSQDARYAKILWGDGNFDLFPNVVAVPAFNVNHTYNSKGVYTTSVIVRDRHACPDTTQFKVYSIGPNSANFSIPDSNACAPFPLTFIDAAPTAPFSISDSTIVKWDWDWDNNGTFDTTTTAGLADHTFLKGVYSVKMRITDKNGCTSTVTKNNLINATFPAPAFAVSDTFTCKKKLITFDASSTSTTANANYHWDYGDVATLDTTANKATHAYVAMGTYSVTLTVTDQNNCTNTVTHTVQIQHPIADFKITVDSTQIKCAYVPVAFSDQSIGQYASAWYWSFGDGTSSLFQNPNKNYTKPGIFSVKFVVTNQFGCASDTITKDSLLVVPGPYGTWKFSPVSGCNPLTVNFSANSPNTTKYFWDFGDGVVDSTVVGSITHIYNQQSVYYPQLVLSNTTNGVACKAAVDSFGVINVTNLINVDIGPPSVTLSDGDTYQINTVVSNAVGIPTYSWTPSTGLSCTNCPNPIINCTNQTIQYQLTVADPAQGGCVGQDTILIVYKPCETKLVVPNVFTPNNDGINDVFKVLGVCPVDGYELIIYDRWGLDVFTSTKRNEAWDGRTRSGTVVSDGVYYYIVKVGSVTDKGFIQVITTDK